MVQIVILVVGTVGGIVVAVAAGIGGEPNGGRIAIISLLTYSMVFMLLLLLLL